MSPIGALDVGEIVRAQDRTTLAASGQVRVKTDQGWISEVSKTGRQLLQKL
eukprot:SAG31_NODE_17201_length_679_cov_1.086207_2_plen_50_part_01